MDTLPVILINPIPKQAFTHNGTGIAFHFEHSTLVAREPRAILPQVVEFECLSIESLYYSI